MQIFELIACHSNVDNVDCRLDAIFSPKIEVLLCKTVFSSRIYSFEAFLQAYLVFFYPILFPFYEHA